MSGGERDEWVCRSDAGGLPLSRTRGVALQRVGDGPVEFTGLYGKLKVAVGTNSLQAHLRELVQWNGAVDDDGNVCCGGMITQRLDNSKPSIPGMKRSNRIRSGRRSTNFSIASAADAEKPMS